MDKSFFDIWLRAFKDQQLSGELAKLNASHKNKVCSAGQKELPDIWQWLWVK